MYINLNKIFLAVKNLANLFNLFILKHHFLKPVIVLKIRKINIFVLKTYTWLIQQKS